MDGRGLTDKGLGLCPVRIIRCAQATSQGLHLSGASLVYICLAANERSLLGLALPAL